MTTTEDDSALDDLPPLSRDRSFLGMTATQFLGAFNDNLFKQLMLLIAIVVATKIDRQPVAAAMFAVPFVLFSGFAGYLADRYSKRRIIILAKVAEVFVMLAGMAALAHGDFTVLLVVLFCMGTQSAFFGPAKYGILPEMLREKDLARANGVIQMTTFVAIIFGTASAGYLKEGLGDALWMTGTVCVAIAVVGTCTSLMIRRLPPAQPDMPFRLSALIVGGDTWAMLRRDRPLTRVLIVSSAFWFVGAMIQPAVNALGKFQLGMDDAETSLLAAALGAGIAVGCMLAGQFAKEGRVFRTARVGAMGTVICTAALSFARVDGSHLLGYSGSMAMLIALGVFGGMLAVPLQVFMQLRPPAGLKGRMIAAMNFFNWTAMLLSAGVYEVFRMLFKHYQMPPSTMFAVASASLLIAVLLFLPKDKGQGRIAD